MTNQKLSFQAALSLSPSLSLPHEDTARRQPSARKEESWAQLISDAQLFICFCCLSHSVYDTLFWQLELVKTELRDPLN